jgi:hypothetical protein
MLQTSDRSTRDANNKMKNASRIADYQNHVETIIRINVQAKSDQIIRFKPDYHV